MKADVRPAKSSQLDIPSWVPDAIAQHIRAKYAAEVDRVYETALRESGYFEDVDEDDMSRWYLDQIIRDAVNRENVADLVDDDLADITELYLPLACDPRMKSVWRELSRQSSNGGFLHPAHLPPVADAKERQDAAMLELFNRALACRGVREATTTQRQAAQQRDCYLAKADELEHDAIMMLRHRMGMERYLKLKDAAQAYKDDANEVYAIICATALERKHDGRGRWVALTIGNAFHTLFRSPMYRLTATITSVVLGREIKFRTVRQWLEAGLSHPESGP